MCDLERSLRAKMGDASFVSAYRSAFGQLRADRPMGDFPQHYVTLRYVQDMVQMQDAYYSGEEPCAMFMPFGAPGSRTPEPDSQRILSENPYSQNCSENSGGGNKSSSGGCYIATAVYGSYDCPQVWTLRRYRDNILIKTFYGRVFIRLYYIFSPALVRCFKNSLWFKRMCLQPLNKFVKHLENKGFESSPYDDKNW